MERLSETTFENKRLTRRDLLKAGLSTGLALALHQPVNEPAEAHESKVSVEVFEYLKGPMTVWKAEAVALTAATALSEMRPKALISGSYDMQVFTNKEYVRYFARLGLRKEKELVYPEIKFVDFGEQYRATAAFYLLGECYCPLPDDDHHININSRFVSPYSPLQEPEHNHKLVQVIAHEAAHANELSCQPVSIFGDFNMVEGTTQIVALEMLSAMALDGSDIALPAAIGQLNDLAKGYVLVKRNEEGRLDLYEEFLDKFPNHSELIGDWELIKAEGSERGIINAADYYGKQPFEVVAEAMTKEKFVTKELPIPQKKMRLGSLAALTKDFSHFVYDYQHTP